MLAMFFSVRFGERRRRREQRAGNKEKSTHHIVDDLHSLADGTCLESHMVHATDQIIDCYRSAGELIEVQLVDFLRPFWHFDRFD